MAITTDHSTRTVLIELGRQGVFLRLGRVEVYARRDHFGASSWGLFREPRAVELEAGTVRVTLSTIP